MAYAQTLAEAPAAVLAPGAEERRSRRRLIEALALQGTSSEPIQHWTQGLNRIAQAGLSGFEEGRLRKEERGQEERIAAALAGLPGLGGGSQSVSADVQDPSMARAPDGMDRSISTGPRSPSFSPVTTEPPEPSPYKVAGMPPPTNSQDTFRTPLDAMAPREQGMAALRTAMGGQPPMTGMTPAGATPVQTQAITPPAPDAMPPNAAPTQGMLPRQAAAPAIDPASARYIQGLMANRETRQFGMQLYQSLMTKAAGDKPTFGEIGTDPQTGQPMRGFIDARRERVTPYQVPGGATAGVSTIPPVPAGVDPKVWREAHSKAATAEAMPGTGEGAMKLRGEIQQLPSYKNLAQSAPVYRSMLEAAGRDSRSSDVNLIYGMAKLMDPGSVVRESEMTVAQAIATMPQNLQAQIKSQFTASGRLDPAVRAGIMEEAHSRVNAYRGMFDQDAGMYRGIAQRGRFNEADVLPSFGEFQPFTPPAPKTSDVDAAIAEARKRGLIK